MKIIKHERSLKSQNSETVAKSYTFVLKSEEN